MDADKADKYCGRCELSKSYLVQSTEITIMRSEAIFFIYSDQEVHTVAALSGCEPELTLLFPWAFQKRNSVAVCMCECVHV